MRVSCTTCLELLTASDELSSVPCGHVFHTQCILQWFETGKSNCPQCRSRAKESQLRKLYLNEAMDSTMAVGDGDGEPDAGALQNKIDSLKFELRMANTDKKKLGEERDSLAAKNLALKEDAVRSERTKNEAREETANMRTQMRYMQAEKHAYKKAKEESNELREQLELYKAVDDMVRGSMGEVNNRLHDIGDFSKASRELSIIIVGLKRELTAKGEEKMELRAELKRSSARVTEVKSKLSAAAKETLELSHANRSLQSDLRHCEEERNLLQRKMARLEDALKASENGDPKSLDDTQQPAISCEESDSPFLRVKTHSLVGLSKRRKSPCKDATNFEDFNIMKRSRLAAGSSTTKSPGLVMGSQSSSQPHTTSSSSSTSTFKRANSELFYDGLGGHAKPDAFPSLRRDPFKLSKKPKGVARPKTCAQTKGQKLMDQFFSDLQ